MNSKLQKRKISDVVDFLLEDVDNVEQKNIQEVEIKLLENYHNHPFTLYEGKRLEDMVESIKENGILNPIIVLRKEDKYEILSGHNRVNAAKFAGLEVVPCIIKKNLTKEQAYAYVIETNLMQRSFSDLLPTEKATVLKLKYEKIASQGKRNDLKKEMDKLDNGIIEKEKRDKDRADSRKTLGKEYNLSSASVARYLRLNHLADTWKESINNDEITLTMAVDLSYLLEDIQSYLYEQCNTLKISLKPSDTKAFHLMNREKGLDKDMLMTYLLNLKKPKVKIYESVKLSKNTYQKFFNDESKEEIESIIEKALEMYFMQNVTD